MSAATRIPAVASLAAIAAISMAAWKQLAVQDLIVQYLDSSTASNLLKAIIAGIALLNLKNLPGVWHVRVLRGIIYQIYLQPRPIPPKHIFAPVVTRSYNTPYDTDYNLHKSNSTYFTDLDVARAHLVGALLRTGLARLNSGDEEGLPKSNIEAPGKYIVALGAVSCFFQRQIEPLQSYEIYTRVLTWDRKWLYLISHIVKKGAIQPESYVLQPWKKSKKKAKKQQQQQQQQQQQDLQQQTGNGEAQNDQGDREGLQQHVFATSIARYVFKKGRLTINPEIVLERSRLLPARPAGVDYPPRTESFTNRNCLPATGGEQSGASGVQLNQQPRISSGQNDNSGGSNSSSTESLDDGDDDDDEQHWAWDDMERERLHGLALATHFDELGTCHAEVRGGHVLGKFGDFW